MNTKDNFDWTPLHEASNHGFRDITRVLIKAEADINATGGSDNITPISDAAQNGHFEIVDLLFESGADPSIQNTDVRLLIDL